MLVAMLPDAFVRIHKSYLARLGDIVAIHARTGSRYEAELKTGVTLPVGRTYCRALRALLT
jgi:DNA-binding LytR/AlgR family response regulator